MAAQGGPGRKPDVASADRPRLALITCGGKFDRTRNSYPDNLVVYATRAGAPPVDSPLLP